jgi:DNA-binding HxlR family transcriptional regulator
MAKPLTPNKSQLAKAKASQPYPNPPDIIDPRIEALVEDLIGRVADKWTMLILETLAEHGEQRFNRLGKLVGNISQKMLTQTVRQMERDGLLVRTIHSEIPPRVEYKITELGLDLARAFCGVWIWAAENLEQVEEARRKFDNNKKSAARVKLE